MQKYTIQNSPKTRDVIDATDPVENETKAYVDRTITLGV